MNHLLWRILCCVTSHRPAYGILESLQFGLSSRVLADQCQEASRIYFDLTPIRHVAVKDTLD